MQSVFTFLFLGYTTVIAKLAVGRGGAGQIERASSAACTLPETATHLSRRRWWLPEQSSAAEASIPQCGGRPGTSCGQCAFAWPAHTNFSGAGFQDMIYASLFNNYDRNSGTVMDVYVLARLQQLFHGVDSFLCSPGHGLKWIAPRAISKKIRKPGTIFSCHSFGQRRLDWRSVTATHWVAEVWLLRLSIYLVDKLGWIVTNNGEVLEWLMMHAIE